jgi:hypothetical protein
MVTVSEGMPILTFSAKVTRGKSRASRAASPKILRGKSRHDNMSLWPSASTVGNLGVICLSFRINEGGILPAFYQAAGRASKAKKGEEGARLFLFPRS